jgi:putative transposase
MRLQVHRPIPDGAKMKSVSISKKIGKKGWEFYLCITIELDPNKIPPVVEKPTKTIGLDFGIKDNVIDDQNNKYNFPKDKKLEERILRAQHKLSLKTRGSNNWHKAQRLLRKLKTKQTRQHHHEIHNFTHQITNNYDGIAFEDYKVKDIVGNTQKDKKLYNKQKQAINKKSLEAGIYSIKTQLQYKSALRGNVVEAVDSAYTTQDCSCCGYRNSELSLTDREWECPECGTHHDRDQNAAQNIKKAVFG